MKENYESLSSATYSASVFAIKNKRRKMEDRHVIHHDLNALLNLKDVPIHSYYAVFDGHSGIDAASYASAHLHVNIAKHPAFLTDTPKAIAEAYRITDENFLKTCSKENIKSGCTAVCALIREKTIYLSWLGDSQAVLVRKGKPSIITEPHKPERQDERERIESLGGHITHMGTWRVNGILAVTRALGDPDHKPFISNEPDVYALNLDGSEDFLILACDGLWDGISPDDVASALYNDLCTSTTGDSLDTTAANLVHKSKLQGSEDNITAVVIFLRDIEKIKEDCVNFMPDGNKINLAKYEHLCLNGEQKECFVEDVSGASFMKPTVLELNSASSKKLKNTANILSSAGIGNVSYSYQYEGNATEGKFLENVDFATDDTEQNIFIPNQNVASCFAPEATALSELPTPPIDDFLASQQFEKFSAVDLYQGLNTAAAQSSTDPFGICSENPKEDESALMELHSVPLNTGSSPNQLIDLAENEASREDLFKNETLESRSNEPTQGNITPDEAVGIASCVVSDAIQTAVKCLSSNDLPTPPSPPVLTSSKLNPYAEPFVMKSFQKEETEFQDKTNVTNNNLESESTHLLLDNLKNPSENNELLKNSETSQNMDSCVPANISDSFSNISPETSVPSEQSLTNLKKEKDETKSFIDNNEFQSSHLISACISQDLNKSESEVTDKSITHTVCVENIQNNELFVAEVDSSCITTIHKDVPEQVTAIQNKLLKSSSVHDSHSEAPIEKIQPTFEETNQEITVCYTEQNCKLINLADSKANEVDCNETNSECLFQNPEKCETDLLDEVLQKEACETQISEGHESITSESVNSNAENDETDLLDEVLQKEACETQISEGHESITSESVNSNAENLDHSVAKTAEANEAELLSKSLNQEPVSLITVQEVILRSTEAVLPSDQAVEDTQVENFAVDLQTVPVGVPEAEGVTEDIDSDSEKDGGWSYMKGNAESSCKSKISVHESKVNKSVDKKSDTSSRMKKDMVKSLVDPKNKTKTVIPLDKTKKLVPERPLKNLPDSKDRSKLVKSSTLTTTGKINADKGSRTTSTASRIRKETAPVTAKASSDVVLKVSKPTVQRNQISLSKPASNLTSTRSSALSSGVSSKPKSALSGSEAKSNLKPAASSTVPKGLPSTQSNKSNLTSTRSTSNRSVTSSVPNKVSVTTKIMVASKSTLPEPKTKQPVFSVRKTVSSAFKKPDIKETKDNVNKQILAGKSVPIRSQNKADPTANSSKSTIPVGSKPVVAKTRTAVSVKSDIGKKDGPKIPASKISARSVTSKTSKDITKEKNKKSVLVNRRVEEKIELSSESKSEGNIEAACISEEEKFILEANDKETVVKEQSETFSDMTQNQCFLENGSVECMKTIEDNQTVVECASENIL
ncbi:uncharacterized protein LOC118202143 [Stegodyphus dumicola]|uniref:uncharacterized protein LOC118202143 n=1 Tax=Stegodyphus dumicola TaxID=202533 RepID=UPI0015AE273A|nr:uncharacterized protein LOC118202143 [Stegodyphus dumicola]